MKVQGFEKSELKAMRYSSHINLKNIVDGKVEYTWLSQDSNIAESTPFQKDIKVFLTGISYYFERLGGTGRVEIIIDDLHLGAPQTKASLHQFLMFRSLGITSSHFSEQEKRSQLLPAFFTQEADGWSMQVWGSSNKDKGLYLYLEKRIDWQSNLEPSVLVGMTRGVSTGEYFQFGNRWYRPVVVPSLETGKMLDVYGFQEIWPMTTPEKVGSKECAINKISFESDRCALTLLKRESLFEIEITGENFDYFQRAIASGKPFVGMGDKFVFCLEAKDITEFISRSILETENVLNKNNKLINETNNALNTKKLELENFESEALSKKEVIARLNQQIANLQKTVQDKNTEIETKQAELKQCENEALSKKQEFARLNQQIANLQRTAQDKNTEIETKQAELKQCENEALNKMIDIEKESQHLSNQITNLNNQLDLLNKEIDTKKEEIQQLERSTQLTKQDKNEATRSSKQSVRPQIGLGLIALAGLLYYQAEIKSFFSTSLLSKLRTWN